MLFFNVDSLSQKVIFQCKDFPALKSELYSCLEVIDQKQETVFYHVSKLNVEQKVSGKYDSQWSIFDEL